MNARVIARDTNQPTLPSSRQIGLTSNDKMRASPIRICYPRASSGKGIRLRTVIAAGLALMLGGGSLAVATAPASAAAVVVKVGPRHWHGHGHWLWHGRYWGHRTWACHRWHSRRACAYRYW